MAIAGDIVLITGRRLSLRELRQYLTYEGLLEGLPTADMNNRNLDRLIVAHRDKPYAGGPYLIQPIEKPIDCGNYDRPYPFGTPSALPAVTCIGRFDSLQAARNRDSDMSGLVVIWFQEEFAFPIDPDVFTKLQAIDWETHAADMNY